MSGEISKPSLASPPPLPARPQPQHDVSGSILSSKRSLQLGLSDDDQWIAAPDPRASSAQSLRPDATEPGHRRTLLLIYIHGFYGNKQSFRSFPYHVHSYLRSALADSHVIHSKIYPRYKTYRAIEIARDNFSEWLIPHESATTDVILVGHSMGGILAAEIVLMPNRHPYSSHPFKHRILGTISLDAPFLGLHPGIVVAGVSSLFRAAPEHPEDGQDRTDSAVAASSTLPLQPLSRQPTDPYYDPPFWNDKQFKEAPFVQRIMNFARKHKQEGIFNAATNHVMSHLEYGGCLADYPGLNKRYDRIRSLEDVDELEALTSGGDGNMPSSNKPKSKVRFVNYYTLSSGRPKKPKTPGNMDGADSSQASLAPTPSLQTLSITESMLSREQSLETQDHSLGAGRSSVSISVDDYGSGKVLVHTDLSSIHASEENISREALVSKNQTDDRTLGENRLSRLSMQDVDPIPMSDHDEPNIKITDYSEGLPPIPDSPTRPVEPDIEQYTDKDARKQVEREHRRQMKTYEKAVKDKKRAIREREKLIEKRRKKAQNKTTDSDASSISSIQSDDLTETQQQQLVEFQQQNPAQPNLAESSLSLQRDDDGFVDNGMNLDGCALSMVPSLNRSVSGVDSVATNDETDKGKGKEKEKEKEKKKKKFCSLPKKVNGKVDPTWVDVYMDGMDEVGAHCGLFFSGPHYDKLIGDVSSRIISWVQDDMTKRAILDLQHDEMMAMSPTLD